MKVVGIVESRMSSTRLPGKNLKPLLGRPMVVRLLERLKRAHTLDAICVATSTEPADQVLEDWAVAEGVSCFRGSLDDVLARTLGAARSMEADVIVEITGDCPLIDPGIVDAAVARHRRGDVDYVANVLDALTFPIGFDVQVYATRVLEQVAVSTQDPYDRQNVTPFIYRNPDRFRLLNVRATPELDRPRYFLCVDHPEDFALIRTVYEALHPRNAAFSAADVIRFLDERPDLVRSNNGREGAFTFPSSGGRALQEVIELDGR
jgi:spore coat polysaccharide biosynthesis protein SpsF